MELQRLDLNIYNVMMNFLMSISGIRNSPDQVSLRFSITDNHIFYSISTINA
jgi:hypothetical protein